MTDVAVAPRAQRRTAHPDTSTIFVMGLLSLSGYAFVLGIAAWYFGNRLLRTYDAEPGRWDHRGLVVAGRTMGMVGTALGIVVVGLTIAFKL
jgi:hypothetical protein